MNKLFLSILLFSNLSRASDGNSGDNHISIIMFVLFVSITLFITYWASKSLQLQMDFIPRVEIFQAYKTD